MKNLFSKEKIIALINRYWKFDDYQSPTSNWHDKQDLLKELESMEAHSIPNGKWISINDKMPNKYQFVIVYFPKGKFKRINGRICEAWYNGKYWDNFALLAGENEHQINVTHWMPLPEAPKN